MTCPPVIWRAATASSARSATRVTASAGKPQISYGLCCAPAGQPVSIEVHKGNTGDPTTLLPALERVKQRFGIEHVVFVGDRGMITEARVKALKTQGVGFITSLRAPQIQKLTVAPGFQLSLFDEHGLCEISSPEFPSDLIRRAPGRRCGWSQTRSTASRGTVAPVARPGERGGRSAARYRAWSRRSAPRRCRDSR